MILSHHSIVCEMNLKPYLFSHLHSFYTCCFVQQTQTNLIFILFSKYGSL
ncbi:unnamed protein product [Paramecium octaurelia]|uniref:Uncharacterized protein n=1 Tax=Paramecium octaurelia TaxID=43137 RepID=A0A8S1XLH9_PAROT|nr:unnamed protein product [Paramecium octaurelia]